MCCISRTSRKKWYAYYKFVTVKLLKTVLFLNWFPKVKFNHTTKVKMMMYEVVFSCGKVNQDLFSPDRCYWGSGYGDEKSKKKKLTDNGVFTNYNEMKILIAKIIWTPKYQQVFLPYSVLKTYIGALISLQPNDEKCIINQIDQILYSENFSSIFT